MELFVSTARAQDETVVDLSSLDSSKPKWNPYQFERQPILIAVPVIILLMVALHLIRRKKRTPLNRARAEEYFND